MKIFIISRQSFYKNSRGEHIQMCNDNPVIEVYQSFNGARDHIERMRMRNYPFHRAECLYECGDDICLKVIIRDNDNYPVHVYSIIRKEVMS